MVRFYVMLAWRNLWRNKRRTYITLFAIHFAIFFALMMRSMQLGSYESMIQNTVARYTGHIQVHKFGFWESRSFDDLFFDKDQNILQILKKHTEIEHLAPRLETFVLAAGDQKTRASLTIGLDPELDKELSGVYQNIVTGRYFSAIDSNAVILSEGLATYLNLSVGDSLIMLGQGYHGVSANAALPIVGIVRLGSPELNRASVYIPLKTAHYVFGAEHGLSSYSLLLKIQPIFHRLRRI